MVLSCRETMTEKSHLRRRLVVLKHLTISTSSSKPRTQEPKSNMISKRVQERAPKRQRQRVPCRGFVSTKNMVPFCCLIVALVGSNLCADATELPSAKNAMSHSIRNLSNVHAASNSKTQVSVSSSEEANSPATPTEKELSMQSPQVNAPTPEESTSQDTASSKKSLRDSLQNNGLGKLQTTNKVQSMEGSLGSGGTEAGPINVVVIKDGFAIDIRLFILMLTGGLLGMIFSAWQMADFPDGPFAVLCRAIISALAFVFNILLLRPCRRRSQQYGGHIPVSTMDYGFKETSFDFS